MSWKNIDINLLRIRLGVPAIGGLGVTSPHRKQRSGEISMSAKNVKKLSQTKKNSSTTSCLLLKSQGGLKAGMCMYQDCSLADQGGRFCASLAMQPKQLENEKNEKLPQSSVKCSVGTKHDQNKPALAYIPKAALYAEGQAFAYGAKKYDAWNYKNGIKVSRTLSAALRHISQFIAGETVDVESNVHHLGCARANLAMALDTLENHPEFDDRFKGGKK